MSDHRIEATTLGDLLLRATDRFPAKDAIVFPDGRLTFAELTERAYFRARSLASLGVKRGDHVGILMPNCLEYVELIFATAFMGCMAVPINARNKVSELAYVIRNADLRALVTTDLISEYADFSNLIHEAFPALAGSADPRSLDLADAPELKFVAMMGESTPDSFVTQAEFEAMADGTTVDDIENWRISVQLSDRCIMMYTSGTTANPKGCPISHEKITRNSINIAKERFFLTEDDVYWAPLPMFHMASTLPMTECLWAGATMLSMTHFDAGVALKMMEEEKVTVAFPSFPTVTNELVTHPEFEKRDLSRLRIVQNVAPEDLLRRFQEAFPQAAQTGAYGLTECTGIAANNSIEETFEERLHAQGKPFPGMEAMIVDPETFEEKPYGERGEIVLRGYAVFEGYYNAPDKNAEAFKDGWFRTGDLCSMDADNNIHFHGRIKDMLKVGGENVAAVEIESFLQTHPSVKLAQVIGVPDSRLLEVAAAYIELIDGTTLTEQELIDFCQGKIASFKVPRHVRFVTEWPMSSTKVQKFRLRDDFLAEAETAAQ